MVVGVQRFALMDLCKHEESWLGLFWVGHHDVETDPEGNGSSVISTSHERSGDIRVYKPL